MAGGGALPLLLLAASLVPALLTLALPEGSERTRVVLNLSAAVLKVVLVGVLVYGVFTGSAYEWRVAFLPGIDLVLRVDPIPLLFVFLSSLLWLTTTVYAVGYLQGHRHHARFFGFFGLCVTATVGIALAGNLVTFLVFYELLTVATYPLVVHDGTDRARAAGRTYLVYTLTGGSLLLLGTAWLHAVAGPIEFGQTEALVALLGEHRATLTAIFLVLIAGLGVKAALVPLHGWLPQAMVAPAPVSALLHAVAVVKAGVYGIVRVVHDLFGMPLADELGVLTPLAIVAAVTIVYGSVRALFQDDLKRRLAYSTISQLSYIVLGVSVLGVTSTTAGLVHLVHQGVTKVTLFYCAGNLDKLLGVTRISEMRGVGRRLPLTMTAFTIAAVGMVGIPPTAGFVTKWYLGLGAVEGGQPWVLGVLAISIALNAAYYLPPVAAAWFRPADDREEDDEDAEDADAEVAGDRAVEGVGGGGDGTGGEEADAEVARVPELVGSGPRRDTSPRWLVLPPVVTGASVLLLGLFAGAPGSPLSWAALIAEELMAS